MEHSTKSNTGGADAPPEMSDPVANLRKPGFLQWKLNPILKIAGNHLVVTQLIVLAAMCCVGFAAWAISDLAGIWFIFALIPAALMLHIQLCIGFLAKSSKPLLATLGLALYLTFSAINTLLGGGGATAVFSSSALGSKNFETATAPALAQIDAVAASASIRSQKLNSLSIYSMSIAQTEASAGKTCDPEVGQGEGDYFFIRSGDGKRMAELAGAAKRDAETLNGAKASVAKEISRYSVESHDKVSSAISTALTTAQAIGRNAADPAVRAELSKRLSEAQGAIVPGPKTGSPVVCKDLRLAGELQSVLSLPTPVIPNAKLPGPPDHRAAVVAFSSAVFDAILGRAPFDWSIYGWGLAGVLPDIIMAWAIFVLVSQLRALSPHLSPSASIAEQIGRSVNDPDYSWTKVREAAAAAANDNMLNDLRALKVIVPGWPLADRHYIAVPFGPEFEPQLHIAQMLVIAGEAIDRGFGKLGALFGRARSINTNFGLETIVTVFELRSGAWERICIDVRKATAKVIPIRDVDQNMGGGQ